MKYGLTRLQAEIRKLDKYSREFISTYAESIYNLEDVKCRKREL